MKKLNTYFSENGRYLAYITIYQDFLGIYYFAQYEMCQFPFCVLSRIAIKPVSYGSFMFVFLNASSKDDEEYDHLPQYLVKRLNQNLLITDRYVDPSGQLQQQTIDAGVLI